MPQWCHLLLGQPGAGRCGSPQGGGAAVAGAVGSGVNAAVSWRPLKVVVAVQLRFGALPTVIPFLITVSTGGIAGECIAAGMAGVVAVRLQKKQQNYDNGEEKNKGLRKPPLYSRRSPTWRYWIDILRRLINSENLIPAQCTFSVLTAHKNPFLRIWKAGKAWVVCILSQNTLRWFLSCTALLSPVQWNWLSYVDFDYRKCMLF